MESHLILTFSNSEMFKFWFRRFFQQLKIWVSSSKQIRDKERIKFIYSNVGLRDLDFYFNPLSFRTCIVNDRLIKTTSKTIRDFHLSIVEKYIRDNNVGSALELGSGTSINIFLLKKKLTEVNFTGIDLVEERVTAGLQYFKARNFVPNVMVGDVTALPFEDNSFDLVFSVHCFEQLNRYAERGISEALRVAKIGVIFLEPDWKNSNWAQKLFLINNNYLINFGGKIKKQHTGLIHRRLGTYFNPLNKTGLFLINLTQIANGSDK